MADRWLRQRLPSSQRIVRQVLRLIFHLANAAAELCVICAVESGLTDLNAQFACETAKWDAVLGCKNRWGGVEGGEGRGGGSSTPLHAKCCSLLRVVTIFRGNYCNVYFCYLNDFHTFGSCAFARFFFSPAICLDYRLWNPLQTTPLHVVLRSAYFSLLFVIVVLFFAK